MPSVVIAVAFGVLISLVNFLVVAFLSIKAQKKETTTAAAITVASFIVRLTLLFFLFLYLVNNSVWGSYIYSIMAGFIPAYLLLMILEIKILLKLEAQPGFSKGVVKS